MSISNPLFVAVIILAGVVVILAVLVAQMYMKLRRFLVKDGAETIADSLSSLKDDLSSLEKFRVHTETYLADVEHRLRRSVQTVNTVRFNPFKGAGEGGNQSFATAFLNEDGDGVVISSLHNREHVRVFSKPIHKNTSEYELSDEEQQAIGARN